MEPVAVRARDDGEWAVVHRCRGCATVRLNRIACDDNSHVLHNLAGVP
jgi:ribosome biogenesis GTPase